MFDQRKLSYYFARKSESQLPESVNSCYDAIRSYIIYSEYRWDDYCIK